MKELSIEEKAKRYDEAIKIAKEINNEQRAQPFNVMTRVFPELKESENEKIRKEITTYLKSVIANKGYGDSIMESWIAWLEKKAEKKDILEDAILDGNEDGLVAETIHYKKETQSEQKSTEWEPQTGDTFRKKGTTSPTYHLCNKREDGITFGFVENCEVGIAGGEITIFALRNDYELVERPKSIEDVVKEELNKGLQTKVGQNIVWSKEDIRLLNNCIGLIEDIDCTKEEQNWLKCLKDRVQPKQEWTWKEFEKVRMIIAYLEAYKNYQTPIGVDYINSCIDWFKSLRPQLQWKLSEEQIKKDLDKAANEWECKASFSPIAMVMDGDRPIGTTQHITSHADSFKAGVDWVIKKLKGENV